MKVESRSYSLVSNVIKVLIIHVRPLNAQEVIAALAQAGAFWQSRVVDDDFLSRVPQVLNALWSSCSPMSP